MPNTQKYFLVLESLKYGKELKAADNDVKNNLLILKKYLKTDDIIKDTTLKQFGCDVSENATESWTTACFLFHVLLTIKNNINMDSASKEDLISVRHLNDYLQALKLASRYGVVHNLPKALKEHPVFQTTIENDSDNINLRASLLILADLFRVLTISSNRAIDSVVLEVMAGIYSSLPDYCLIEILTMLWEHTPKENYFRYLLILKSITNLPGNIQEKLHADLLGKLQEPGGFKLLILNTVPAMSSAVDVPNWKRYEVVARIVAHKGHSNEFFKRMITEIFQFTENSLFDTMEKSLVPAGIVTLRKLCLLDEKLRNIMEEQLAEMYKSLVEPQDVVTGLIVMDSSEFQRFLLLLCAYFNGSSFEALPSTLLVKYIPVLIALTGQMEGYAENKDLTLLVSQCLSNRNSDELRIILKSIFHQKENAFPMKFLHDRITLRRNETNGQYSFQIGPQELRNSMNLAAAFVKIMKNSNNNILIYNCFLQILMILEESEPVKSHETEIDLLRNEEEFDVFLVEKFQVRISVVSCLTELVSYRPFHSQFHENPGDVLDFLQNAIGRRINSSSADSDANFPILLAVFQEFIESAKDYDKYRAVSDSLKTYLKRVQNVELKNQIRSIVSLIEDGPRSLTIESSQFNFARSLLSDSQSHLRVYGITQLIKLLNDRDDETLSNRHSIMAMALHALRDDESYTYLNCVRLFVCLMNSMRSEVLESLSAEYLNENEDVEFRLKIGEAMVKVTEDLGPLSYSYKDVLINCFLHGCNHKINEFRASSLSNLSTICRLLSYQVHNFFQEMMSMIESTLQTDTYLPARRASVLILSQLLWGMENLKDFEDNLLPIYRLLNSIVANDSDEKTRIHATNGLKYLKEKCKTFLFPEQKIEKEIKIFGVKDDASERKRKGHILEL